MLIEEEVALSIGKEVGLEVEIEKEVAVLKVECQFVKYAGLEVIQLTNAETLETTIDWMVEKERNQTAELAASSCSGLTLAMLINNGLFPVRFPIMLALMSPVVTFLARRNLFKLGL
ncbi:Protein of unknown function (DUF1279 [Striga hermonthica]|uniref:DUF1279 domain-containing protein n=1 Tax=Striga hermonthica TaxID=68872 RepID=A0A9N7NSV6_STRHE|nr:Protein of unknown function (DUF1279 [Striga hermonthica]